jgi:CheY-like chemotaxis protein
MKKRVLVVEDHAVNRILLSTMLKKLDLPHDLAENGKIALDMIEYVQYDLVLMDIFMPVMGGLEALEKIKAHDISMIAKIPVIAVTAKPESEDIDKFDAVIPKPIDALYLQEVLGQLLGFD